MVLDQGVSPVTFSVANTMKRVAVVVSAVMFFKCAAAGAAAQAWQCAASSRALCAHAAAGVCGARLLTGAAAVPAGTLCRP